MPFSAAFGHRYIIDLWSSITSTKLCTFLLSIKLSVDGYMEFEVWAYSCLMWPQAVSQLRALLRSFRPSQEHDSCIHHSFPPHHDCVARRFYSLSGLPEVDNHTNRCSLQTDHLKLPFNPHVHEAVKTLTLWEKQSFHDCSTNQRAPNVPVPTKSTWRIQMSTLIFSELICAF